MNEKAPRCVFGPVLSRRLGRSLGIDLCPFKTCTWSCVYCQLGPTEHPTLERREWVPIGEVIEELRAWARSGEEADVATLAGSGEPTLHTGFGRVLEAIREETGLPSVLLTNGSLLHLPEVRRDAARADIVKVTFSAPDAETMRRLHRPAAGLDFDQFLEGVRAFAAQYAGRLWLEVMALGGVNDSPEAMARLADLARPLHPERIQMNTVVRPPAESAAAPVERGRLEALASLFEPRAEIVGLREDVPYETKNPPPDETRLLALLRRHPASAEEIARLFGAPVEAVRERLQDMAGRDALEAFERDGRTTYAAGRASGSGA